ncbi:hypothetical protein GM418_20415 [Maribellus comscasis]|uniref:O-antigen ligase-related domain-containing protein n=1 Tax=Maribellus comscasis TaxID=2681766 RepID=A0A6I6JSG0_9BACT|nr:O-antigen ligase family protein [Maribellus comscasis]QGY45946.1 hypothetical protein GM418_20415 [Maribellus comscasis]
MGKHVSKLIDDNWFFVSLLVFVVVLPLSQALVSICAGGIFATALIEDNWKNKLIRIKKNKVLFSLPAIYGIYILSSVVSNKFSASLYDLQKSLFFLVIPFAFIMGKKINDQQKRFIFYLFLVSIIVSTVIAILKWKIFNTSEVFSVHKASLVSHIRFSFQLILAFWFVVLLVHKNFGKITFSFLLFFIAGACYFVFFLLFQQSLTGLIAFAGSIVFYLILLGVKLPGKNKFFFFIITMVLIAAPSVYILKAIEKFYDFEKVDKTTIDKKTTQGNLYSHDFDSPMVENGRYVYLYVCQREMKEAWNKVAEIKYDSLGANGYPVYSTLIRYLTSKGLRKDAAGVEALTGEDILNIENGIANVVYAGNKFSLYPRIYQTIWEYYTYTKTGNANQKSFSQRIEYAKAAISIVKKHPWFGVGTGNWKDEFKKAYARNNPHLNKEYYASSHNQYLNYMVKFGIIGFGVVLFFVLYPVFKTKRYKDHLFLLFLVFMFFANFADSNLESHMGSSFFVFFYCIFISGEISYLELPWQKQP